MAKDIDWNFIKTEYEETTKSIRMIAREHNITHGAIQRAIKKENWEKFNFDGVVNDKALLSGKTKNILGKTALRKIKELKAELGDNLSPLDEPLIVIYAKNYERWLELQVILEEEGYVTTSSKGSVYISPYENISKSTEKTLVTVANQLGLSISSRKRLGMSTNPDQQESSLFDITKELEGYEVDV